MMDNGEEETVVDHAIAWHQAVVRDEVDWEKLTQWLEADLRHRDAFNDVSMIDAAIDGDRESIRKLLPSDLASDEARPRVGRRWMIGSGIAAALAVAVALPILQSPDAAPAVYATDAGSAKAVTLADGSQIALSAASAVEIADHQHRIALTRGAAVFDIRHDPSRQMTVTAGPYRIIDIGTRFAIDTAPGHVSVAVAKGQVSVTKANAQAVTVRAGYRLSSRGSAPPRLSPIALDSIGSWQRGRLVYDDAPLPMVAADITRYLGTPIVLAPALGDRRFSGVLVIGNGSRLVSDLAGVAGLSVRRQDGAVMLGAGARP